MPQRVRRSNHSKNLIMLGKAADFMRGCLAAQEAGLLRTFRSHSSRDFPGLFALPTETT
jgi:hypothetical protein